MTINNTSACPLSYKISLKDIAKQNSVAESTVYIIGGLYGNVAALDEILTLAKQEESTPALIFNGDFNWFNRCHKDFNYINNTVLQYTALKGNIETELSAENSDGCGCFYPDWVDKNTIKLSDEIIKELRKEFFNEHNILLELSKLPSFYKININGSKILIVHGTPEHLSGWDLSYEAMPKIGKSNHILDTWFTQLDIDIIACTHTCLPFLQNFQINNKEKIIINNGSAGMPNFSMLDRSDLCGVITRISTAPTLHKALYGTYTHGVYIDAIPVAYDQSWVKHFCTMWEVNSPAYKSYYKRISTGTNHSLAQANKIYKLNN